MRRGVELVCFTGLALIAHASVWIGFAKTGSESAGANGQATISLMAASGEVAELVEDWTRPVAVMQEVQAALTVPDLAAPDITPPEPVQETASPTATPRMPAPVEQMPNLPRVVTPPPISTPENPSQPQVDRAPPPSPDAPALSQQPVTRTALAQPVSPAPPSKPALPQADTQSTRPEVMKAAPTTSLRPQKRPAKPAQTARHAPEPAKPTPAPRTATPAPQSTGATLQTAAGNRTGTNAGNADTQRASTVSLATRKDLMAQWGASIRNRVERRKRYPNGTRASGTTVLRITMARSGGLASVSVVRSSGTQELDQAAVQAVRRARYPAAPKGLDAAQYQFNLPLAFSRR